MLERTAEATKKAATEEADEAEQPPRSARQIIQEYQESPQNYADPTVEYSWDKASPEARRLVCPEEPEDGFLPAPQEAASQVAKL